MSPRKPWEPKIERLPEFNPFVSATGDQNQFTRRSKLRNPTQDTAPLQGSKDLSDDDSLEDVIADAYGEQSAGAAAAPETKMTKD